MRLRRRSNFQFNKFTSRFKGCHEWKLWHPSRRQSFSATSATSCSLQIQLLSGHRAGLWVSPSPEMISWMEKWTGSLDRSRRVCPSPLRCLLSETGSASSEEWALQPPKPLNPKTLVSTEPTQLPSSQAAREFKLSVLLGMLYPHKTVQSIRIHFLSL